MNIIIIGAGLVGSSLAEHLLQQGHNVAIIENSSTRCENIGNKLDAMMVNGSGSNPRDLERAGIEQADMIIASTPVDEINLVACMIARQYEVPHRIARIRNADFIEGSSRMHAEDFGITRVIYPEENTKAAVLNYVETPFAIDAQDFHGRTVLLRTFQIREGMAITNRNLIDLRNDPSGKALLVVAILRGHEVIIPKGETVILPGDKPVFVFPRESREYVLSLVGQSRNTGLKVVVYGNTLTALNIASALQEETDSIVFIDPDLEHGNRVAAQLDGIDVLHGRGDDVDVLQEANTRFADFFIAASEHNDENILSCLLAKSEGAKEVIAIVNDDKHLELFRSIGINHIINPRQLTASGILSAVIPGYLTSSLHIEKTDIDVLRLKVTEQSAIAGTALKDGWKKVKGVAIVGAVVRNDEMIVPTGATSIQPGDIVIVFSRAGGIKNVQKLFR